jgi:hypothetical protein
VLLRVTACADQKGSQPLPVQRDGVLDTPRRGRGRRSIGERASTQDDDHVRCRCVVGLAVVVNVSGSSRRNDKADQQE